MQTIWAAYAGFQQKDKGSIEVGKPADLDIVSGDPLTTPPAQLADLQTEITILAARSPTSDQIAAHPADNRVDNASVDAAQPISAPRSEAPRCRSCRLLSPEGAG
jgi:Amidohydrolase family